jgi:hypothetical protein
MDKRTCNFHNELWSVVRSCWNILNLAQSEHAVDDFAKDDVLPVEEIARCGRDEELHISPVKKDEGGGEAGIEKRAWQPFVLGPELAYSE